MTIEITRPEIETIINQRLASGAFQDAEEVIFEALQASEKPLKEKTLSEVFAPLRGLELDFSRNQAPGRSVDL